jgi:uncharacterized membrane protein
MRSTLNVVAIIVVYILICTVRMTMPGLDPRDRNRIGGLRVAMAIAGALAAYGFMYLVFRSQGKLVRDPENAQHIGLLIFGLVVSIGEYLSRRKLRSLNIFPQNKKIPWTY